MKKQSSFWGSLLRYGLPIGIGATGLGYGIYKARKAAPFLEQQSRIKGIAERTEQAAELMRQVEKLEREALKDYARQLSIIAGRPVDPKEIAYLIRPGGGPPGIPGPALYGPAQPGPPMSPYMPPGPEPQGPGPYPPPGMGPTMMGPNVFQPQIYVVQTPVGPQYVVQESPGAPPRPATPQEAAQAQSQSQAPPGTVPAEPPPPQPQPEASEQGGGDVNLFPVPVMSKYMFSIPSMVGTGAAAIWALANLLNRKKREEQGVIRSLLGPGLLAGGSLLIPWLLKRYVQSQGVPVV